MTCQRVLGALPAVRQVLRRVLPGTALVLGLLGLALVQAAPVSGELPSGSSTSSGSGSTTTPGTSATNTAKPGNPPVSTGNKNLDLLLEMRSQSGEGDKGGLTAGRSGSATTGGPGLRAPSNVSNNPGGNALLSGETGLGGNHAPASGQGAKREWSGSGAMSSSDSGMSNSPVNTANERDRPAQQGAPDDAVPVPNAILKFMREYRYWVAGLAVILLFVGGALTGYGRRN